MNIEISITDFTTQKMHCITEEIMKRLLREDNNPHTGG
jgi:hypothetical protein